MFSVRVKKFTVMAMILPLLIPSAFVRAEGEEKQTAQSVNVTAQDNYYFEEYENYLNSFQPTDAGTKVVLKSADALGGSSAKSVSYADCENALEFTQSGSFAEWDFHIEESNFYEISLAYAPLRSNGYDITVSLQFDGKYPFGALEEITLSRFWKNSTDEFEKDKNGNDITPEQEMAGGFVTDSAEDKSGIVLEPYRVYLERGSHKFKLISGAEAFVLSNLSLTPYTEIKPYSDVYDSSKKSDSSAETIYIEGEKADLKTANSLSPKSDSDASLTPNSATNDYLNCIGGTTWQSAGDTLYWNFNVKYSGYYKLAFNYKQSDVINGESFRWIKIDGKTPFKELENIRFSYTTKWKYSEFTNEKGEPYYIWLDEGNHTFSMEVTMSEVSEYFKRLRKIVDTLGEEYMEIVMITGDSPDVNRDYELFKQIPNLNETLNAAYKDLKGLAADIEKASGERSNQYVASFNNMARVIKNMVDSPYMAHQYVKNYYTNYCTVSSWLYDMKQMPIKLDQIQLVPSEKEYPGVDKGFFKSLTYSFKRFAASFAGDYTSDQGENDTQLELWVNWGIDQSKALTSLVQQSFTKKTGISVNVRVTNASLVKGILSGNYPDVSLHLARTEPVNLGIRGALYDLKNFADYDEVLKRFQKGAEIPYTYNGKAYALPDTQAFYIMFYRTDILEELDLEIPTNWDEFLRVATIIQRSNMQIYIPYTQITTTTTVNTGLGGLNLYPTLMAQNKVSIYNDSKNACQINTPAATSVFKFWTDLYTEYKYLREADFYNRFRVGSMPLGVAPYATYMTLVDAAPEIKGKWGIACVPGMSGGSNAVAGSGTGCSIVKKSSHKEEAWEFLKWWTSADTQLRYSNNVESMLGTVGRQHTSNVEAFSDMAWDSDAKNVLLEQWSRVEELPEIPGSYYLTRAVDQAFWAVLNSGDDCQATMDKWNDIANGEIARKIKEYE